MVQPWPNEFASVYAAQVSKCDLKGGSDSKVSASVWETGGQEGPLEKEMATHSSILSWRIPWTEETGGLQSMGSQRVGHD